jgi:hypothetical protein
MATRRLQNAAQITEQRKFWAAQTHSLPAMSRKHRHNFFNPDMVNRGGAGWLGSKDSKSQMSSLKALF